MKPILLLLVCLSCTDSFSQNKFGTDGVFEPSARTDPFDPSSLVLSPPTQGFTNKEKDEFKKAMLVYIDALIDNLQDDSLFLEKDYEKIWSAAFYATLLDEAKKLHDYLVTASNTSLTLSYVPSPAAIEALFTGPMNLSIEITTLQGADHTAVKLIATDPFKKFMYDWLSNNLISGAWICRDMDIGYKKSWREMEAAYAQLSASLESLQRLQEKPYILDYAATDRADALLRKWSGLTATNDVAKKIKASAQLQKMLWFTGGIIHMNPLITTDDSKTYPRSEKNTFLKPELLALIDTLESKGWPEELVSTTRIANHVKLPIQSDPHAKINIVQYDAKNTYARYGDIGEYVSKTDKLVIAVHNVSADKIIDITKSEDPLPDRSQFMVDLEETAGKVGSVVTLLNPILGGAGKVIELIQPALLKSAKMLITIPENKTLSKSDLKTEKAITESLYKYFSDDPKFSAGLVKQYVVLIGNKKIRLTGNSDADKRRVLAATYYPDPNVYFILDSTYVFLIDRFVEYHAFTKIDYTQLKSSVDELIDDYRTFVKPVEDYEDKLCDLTNLLATAINEISPFVRISNRSLPPQKIEESVNEKPVYKTVIKDFDLPDAPKKFNYQVSETDKKKEVKATIKNTVKVVKRVYFDISAGLALTLPSYTIVQNSTNNLPERVPGSRFQFMAGGHWYPWGMIKQDDRWLAGERQRFSLFLGLSFNKPLDNYFFGPSYDIIPGLRLIGGVHLYRNTRYKIINNEVAEQARGLHLVGGVLAINIEPSALVNLISPFK